ncbi:molybdate ABC transporter substrate-binding protein [Scytonema sp. NUACC21]
MKNFSLLILISSAILSLVSVSCTPIAKESKPVKLTIYAGMTLRYALIDIHKIYNLEKPNVTITYKFAPSGILKKAIERGDRVDIFMPVNLQDMEDLQSKEFLLTETRQNLLKNRMVLIAPKNTKGISNFKDLTREQVKKVALGNVKNTASGKYAWEILTDLGVLERIKSKLIFTSNSYEVVSFVENGKTDAGISYATDAILSNRIKIVELAPEESHKPIVYPVAVLKSSSNIPEAKEFIQFLRGARAEAVFLKYRFTINSNTSKVTMN